MWVFFLCCSVDVCIQSGLEFSEAVVAVVADSGARVALSVPDGLWYVLAYLKSPL